MDRDSVIAVLTAEKDDVRRRFMVKDIALFGSMARDEATEASDLDVLVTFEGTPNFDQFMGLKLHLEDLFGRRVDLVTPNALREELRDRIEREAIHVS